MYEFAKLVEARLGLEEGELFECSFSEIKQECENHGDTILLTMLDENNEKEMNKVMNDLRELRRRPAHPDFYGECTSVDAIKTLIEQEYNLKVQKKQRDGALALLNIISRLVELE